MARLLQAGTVWLNVYRNIGFNVPFDGYKNSPSAVGQIHEAQIGPAEPPPVFPTFVLLPDVAWQFSPCPTAQQLDPFLACLPLMIAVTNMFNRLNVATRQIAGAWG